MTQGPQQSAAAVTGDPFWSVVRRRHPDIDIVLLPPETAAEQSTPPGTPAEDPPDVAARDDSAVRRLWVRLVGDLGPVEATWEARWVSGGAVDRVRREATLAVEGVDSEVVLERLAAAADHLRDEGWHVVVPPRGMPRVMAGRDAAPGAGLGREEVQLVLAVEGARLVLRVRSLDHVVGEQVAHSLVSEGSEVGS